MFNFQTTNSATDIVRDCHGMSYIRIRKKHCNLRSTIAGGKVSRTSQPPSLEGDCPIELDVDDMLLKVQDTGSSYP